MEHDHDQDKRERPDERKARDDFGRQGDEHRVEDGETREDGEVNAQPATLAGDPPAPNEPVDLPDEVEPVPLVKRASPDIPRPRTMLPAWSYWLLAGSVVVAGAGGAAYWNKTHKPEKAKVHLLSQDQGIPDDFFVKPVEPQVPPAAPAPAAVNPPASPAPVQTVKLAAADLFTVEKVAPPAPVDPLVEAAANLNEQRRGAGQTLVALPPTRAGQGLVYVNTQDKYDDEPQTIASFPVKLDRVITVDRFIHATLIQAINSELSGKVVAQIDENVYCAHGPFICIPAGSHAVGRYKAMLKPGDERIDMYWTRIITPDGRNIHLGDAEMTDAMGRAGITGEVDNRFWDRYGMALMVSTLSIAGSVAIPVTSQTQQVIVQQYGSATMNLAQQILDKNINLKPKITLPPGQPIMISPTKDIWFKKPEAQQSEAVSIENLKGALQ